MLINTLLIFISIAVTVILLVASDWRWTIIGLSLCYLISFALIVQIWPIALASVKLISGLIGIVLLSSVKINLEQQAPKAYSLSYRIFIFLVASLSWMVVTATVGGLNEWLPIAYTNLFVGMIFLLAGLIQFSLFHTPFEIVVGLLVFLTGFDILYSSLEGSALVAGIYGLIVLAISILGGYLESGSLSKVES